MKNESVSCVEAINRICKNKFVLLPNQYQTLVLIFGKSEVDSSLEYIAAHQSTGFTVSPVIDTAS